MNRIGENTKITLTVAQLRKLVNEESGEIVKNFIATYEDYEDADGWRVDEAESFIEKHGGKIIKCIKDESDGVAYIKFSCMQSKYDEIMGELDDWGWSGNRPTSKDFIIKDGVLVKYRGWTSGSGKLSIPSGITEIGKEAFYNHQEITEVIIPDGVTSIGKYAFACCCNLHEIYIPDSVKEIADGAFEECMWLGKGNDGHRYSVRVPGGCKVSDSAFDDLVKIMRK